MIRLWYTGSYAEAVLGQVGRIEAIDASSGMLEVAGRKLAAHPAADRITFTRGSVDELRFGDGEFDAVMVNQVLHHLGDGREEGWQRHKRVISEIARVLRPGGTLVVNTGVIQGGAYFDPRGPLRSDWRSGDSTWALVEDVELADLERRGVLADDMARRDLRRPDIGQITFLAARNDPS